MRGEASKVRQNSKPGCCGANQIGQSSPVLPIMPAPSGTPATSRSRSSTGFGKVSPPSKKKCMCGDAQPGSPASVKKATPAESTLHLAKAAASNRTNRLFGVSCSQAARNAAGESCSFTWRPLVAGSCTRATAECAVQRGVRVAHAGEVTRADTSRAIANRNALSLRRTRCFCARHRANRYEWLRGAWRWRWDRVRWGGLERRVRGLRAGVRVATTRMP